MPEIITEMLGVVDVTLPDKKLQDRFVAYFENIQNCIDMLQEEIIYAAEARDRLLPKLMSGEIEI